MKLKKIVRMVSLVVCRLNKDIDALKIATKGDRKYLHALRYFNKSLTGTVGKHDNKIQMIVARSDFHNDRIKSLQADLDRIDESVNHAYGSLERQGDDVDDLDKRATLIESNIEYNSKYINNLNDETINPMIDKLDRITKRVDEIVTEDDTTAGTLRKDTNDRINRMGNSFTDELNKINNDIGDLSLKVINQNNNYNQQWVNVDEKIKEADSGIKFLYNKVDKIIENVTDGFNINTEKFNKLEDYVHKENNKHRLMVCKQIEKITKSTDATTVKMDTVKNQTGNLISSVEALNVVTDKLGDHAALATDNFANMQVTIEHLKSNIQGLINTQSSMHTKINNQSNHIKKLEEETSLLNKINIADVKRYSKIDTLLAKLTASDNAIWEEFKIVKTRFTTLTSKITKLGNLIKNVTK